MSDAQKNFLKIQVKLGKLTEAEYKKLTGEKYKV